jgi:hypothetical protein
VKSLQFRQTPSDAQIFECPLQKQVGVGAENKRRKKKTRIRTKSEEKKEKKKRRKEERRKEKKKKRKKEEKKKRKKRTALGKVVFGLEVVVGCGNVGDEVGANVLVDVAIKEDWEGEEV